MVTEAMKLKDACFFGRKAMTNLDSILKNRDITLLTRVHIVKAMVFSSSRVWMWELEHKEGWVPKNWYFWIMVLEKSLESPLDFKEIKPVNPKGSDQIRSVAQSCPTLCNPINRSTPGLPVHHQLLEFTQTHVHQVSDAIQPSHPLSSPSPLASNPSQHQSLFQWVSSSHEVAKVLEFQL